VGGKCTSCGDYLEHCGPGCDDCSADTDTPVCINGKCGCAENKDCADAGVWCETNVVPQGICKPCNDDEHCGAGCTDCSDTTPRCRADGEECVECLEHTDCQTEPFNSPVGVCTQNNKCTCWVQSPNDKWECNNHDECNTIESSFGDTFYCALDTNKGVNYVCLRACGDAGIAPENGVECGVRDIPGAPDPFVWAPMTTCYAFRQHLVKQSCTPHSDCSVFGDSTGDGECFGGFCTYTCVSGSTNDDWCPYISCSDTNNYCEHLPDSGI
ncbi:MAG: hypothetical protein GY847_29555, partial [Proteobacteria bacterium]|nr:hypothetical protein [Pseudomonadota bacterium]